MNISSNSSVPNDEPDEIAFLELEEDRRESHDTGGNALSDRYGDEIASEEVNIQLINFNHDDDDNF